MPRGKLKKADETKIRENYNELLEELDARYLVDQLYEKGVIDMNEKEDFDEIRGRRRRTDKLLKRILNSGRGNSFAIFLEILKKEYPYAAEILEGKKKSPPPHVSVLEGKQREQSSQEKAKPSKIMKYTSAPEIINQLGRYGKSCNRDHTTFIPFWAFITEHLPKEYRLQEVYDYIHSLGEQTVFVVGGLVSKRRPKGYFLSDESGTESLKKQRGSGRLRAVLRKFKKSDGIECPCNTCKGASSPEKQWGEYLITCPMHVIFNKQECKSATFRIGYDTDKSKYLELDGCSLMSSDMSLNVSNIKYVSYDYETCMKIESICYRNDMCREKLLTQSHLLENKPKIAVLVSHPHGEPKHVSIGKWVVGNDNLPHSSYRHAYTTAACPLSPGGPVLLLGDTLPCVTMHRRAVPEDGVNQSNGKIWSL